eukprot:2126608-Prymnesium_polylepis.2
MFDGPTEHLELAVARRSPDSRTIPWAALLVQPLEDSQVARFGRRRRRLDAPRGIMLECAERLSPLLERCTLLRG